MGIESIQDNCLPLKSRVVSNALHFAAIALPSSFGSNSPDTSAIVHLVFVCLLDNACWRCGIDVEVERSAASRPGCEIMT
jgi:hypothetical protein